MKNRTVKGSELRNFFCNQRSCFVRNSVEIKDELLNHFVAFPDCRVLFSACLFLQCNHFLDSSSYRIVSVFLRLIREVYLSNRNILQVNHADRNVQDHLPIPVVNQPRVEDSESVEKRIVSIVLNGIQEYTGAV